MQLRRTINAIGSYWDYVNHLWLDVEDTLTDKTPQEIIDWLDAFISLIPKAMPPIGIYTGGWYWIPKLGNTTHFNHLPLWWSYYDRQANFDAWDAHKFGGWIKPLIKQYQGTTQLCGVPVDLNVW